MDLAGGLDLGVLEVAVRAEERHYYDFAEEGDSSEEQAGGPLRVKMLAMSALKQFGGAYILAAVHTQTLNFVDNFWLTVVFWLVC